MRRSLIAPLAALGLALVAFGAGGCAKKVTVDPLHAALVEYPEGDSVRRTPSPSDLVVWTDLPVLVREVWQNGDSSTFDSYRSGPGAIQGVILDYRQASAYQVFREEAIGGYRQFSDYLLNASKRWADRTYFGGEEGTLVLPPAQLFAFSDRAPAPIAEKSYVGRAVIAGLSGASFPLTNRGTTPDTTAFLPLPYTGKAGPAGTADEPPDSLLEMSWPEVPGAAGYWVHIYQNRADIRSSEEAIAIAQPSPIVIGKVRDLFIGYFPAPITAYKLGSTLPQGSRVLVYRVLLGLQEVRIRVSAVDGRGRMIATTGTAGDRDEYQEKIGQIERRRKFFLGAKRVTPGRPLPPD